MANAAPWALPLTLDDANTKIRFEVDSTWHLVKGTTKGVSGSIKQPEAGVPLGIEAELSLPVKLFDTDSSSRDKRLREVMAEEKFPHVTFRATKLPDTCLPRIFEQARHCSGLLRGSLTIRDVTEEVEIPITITRVNDSFEVTGSYAFEWARYKIEDPSILIAKLDPTVTVFFDVVVPATQEPK